MQIINAIGKYKQSNRQWYTRDVSTITAITVHHTASLYTGSDENILSSLAKGHINKDWPGLSYHYIILKNGNIYQINEHNWVTWHDGSNWDSLGVCLHGYFHPQYNENPTKEQLESLKFLLDKLCTEHPEFPADFDDVRGHREVMATACPGNIFYPKVVEYKEKLGKVNWGGSDSQNPEQPEKPIDWKENFNFDVTKKLDDSIYKGLKFDQVAGLPRDTALDNIYQFMKDQNSSIADLEKSNEREIKIATENALNFENTRISKLLGKSTDETDESFTDWKGSVISTAINLGAETTKKDIAKKLGFSYNSELDFVEQINEWHLANEVPSETITIADVLVRIFNKLKDIKL